MFCSPPHTPPFPHPPPPPHPQPHPGGLCLFYWPFWGGGPGVNLNLFCFVVCSTRRFVLCLALYCFVLMVFSPFSIAFTSFGEERATLGVFRTFVRFALVWFCLFSLLPAVWEGLRLVIVALPGLFSYLFFQ